MDIAIDPTAAIQATPEPPDIGVPGGSLGKDEFLQLLMAQLSHQDPLSPVDNTESIAQMAQFSSLEQMQNVSKQLEGMRRESGLRDGLLLQGKNIELLTDDGARHQGTVDRVKWGTDGLTATMNGVEIPFSSVVEIGQY